MDPIDTQNVGHFGPTFWGPYNFLSSSYFVLGLHGSKNEDSCDGFLVFPHDVPFHKRLVSYVKRLVLEALHICSTMDSETNGMVS